MLIAAISKYLKVYENLVFWEHKAHQKVRNEYANFIFDRLSGRDMNLKRGYTLPNLIGYIRKAARNEVLSIFGKEKLTRKTCGKCVFLSLPKPRICQRREIVLMQDGKESHESNPYYNQKRGASDRACKNGFKAFEPDVSLPDEAADETNDEAEKIFHKLEVGDMDRLLSGRYAKKQECKAAAYTSALCFYKILPIAVRRTGTKCRYDPYSKTAWSQ